MSARGFLDQIKIWVGRFSKAIWVSLIQFVECLNRSELWAGENLLSAWWLLSWDGSLLLSPDSDWNLLHQLFWFLGLQAADPGTSQPPLLCETILQGKSLSVCTLWVLFFQRTLTTIDSGPQKCMFAKKLRMWPYLEIESLWMWLVKDKMKSYCIRVVPKSNDWYPCKKRRGHRKAHTQGEGHVKMGERMEWCSYKPRKPVIAGAPRS